MAIEIKQISFTDLRRRGAPALKYATEGVGHLWLSFRGKPRCAIIPLNHERILNRALGVNPDEALHRALVDADRMVSAINERRMQDVLPYSGGYPSMGLDDETYRAWKKERRLINPITGRISEPD